MPISVRKFLSRLKRCELGAPPRDVLRQVQAGDYATGEDVASFLVDQGHLTAWQAKRILAGEVGAFALGRFVLQEPLGRGASGFVFHAVDENGRDRVLKILSPTIAGDPNALERFRREVRATMSLRHPNIVTATETGSDRGLHFIAFEYHAGCDLKRYLANGGLAPQVTASLVRQIADALQHIADVGMVHRDVKPSNIHVAPNGVARLLDLGLARLRHASSEQTVTQTGQILGTVDYISPEQAQDSRLVDIRADIYSLGCTMYECLAGHVPYPDGAVTEKLVKHLTATPAPLVDAVPADLRDIVRKAMSRDPVGRFQQPRELAVALEPFCDAPIAPAGQLSGTRNVPFGLASTIPLDADIALDLELPFVDAPKRSRRLLALVVPLLAALVLIVAFVLRDAEPGSVSITMAPQYPGDARLIVDGIPISERTVPLEPGPHTLRVEAHGYEPHEEQFKVLSEVATELSPQLVATPEFARAARLAEFEADVDSLGDASAKSTKVRELHQMIRKFAQQNPADSVSLRAIGLLSRLPSHFDGYHHDSIPKTDRRAAQWGNPLTAEPDELVAVFNTDRQHEAYSINCVQFLADGRLVSGDESGRITIWKDGRVLRRERMISHGVQTMAVGGGNLFLVGEHGEVRFCEGPDFHKSGFLETIKDEGATAFSPPYHSTRQVTAAATHDGQHVVTSADNLLFLWDADGKSIARRELSVPVASTCFSNEFLVCATNESKLLLLDPLTLKTMHTLAVDYPVLSMVMCKQDTLGIGSSGGSMELWNLKTRKKVFSSEPNGLPVTAVTAAASGGHFLAASGPAMIDTMDVVAPLGGFGFAIYQNGYGRQPGTVTSIDVSPDDRVLAVAGSRFVELYDVRAGHVHDWSAGMPGAMTDIACLPDGTGFLATCGGFGVLRFDFRSKNPTPETLELTRNPVSVAASPAGSMFAVGTTTEGGLLAARSTTTLRASSQFGQGQCVWSPDGRWVVFAGEKHGVVRMRASSFGAPVQTNDLKQVTDVAFSPDSKRYAAVTQTGAVQVFSISEQQPILTASGVGESGFGGLAWSPDGRHLACCRGKTVFILAADSLQPLAELPVAEGRKGLRCSVAFRPDGGELAVADSSRKLTTWDLSSFPATATRDAIQVGPYVNALCYTDDGRHLLTANSDGTVYLLRLRERETR